MLDEVTRLIKEAGGEIINIALGPTKGDKRSYLVRLTKCNLIPIIAKLKQCGYEVVDFIP